MKCGSKATRSNAPCGYALEVCPYPSHANDSSAPGRHGVDAARGEGGASGRASRTPAEGKPAPETQAREVPAAVAGHDLRQLAWWTAGSLIDGTLEARDVSAMCTLIRTLHALGPEPEDEDAVLAEIELRGVVMNGFPPRNEEEWALAAKVFDADAIREFHRWEAEGRGW